MIARMDISPTALELPKQRSTRSNKPSRRNKVSKACNECRKKKVRCDGAQPCERCQKSSIECSFSSMLPRKGPPKEYLEPFEARLKMIDATLRTTLKNYKARPVQFDPIPTRVEGSLSSIGNAPYVPELPFRLDRIEPCQQNDFIEPLEPRLNIKPQVPMRLDLIECYFEYVHPFIPFIDKSLVTAPQPPSLLLHAIYAAASKFHPHEQQMTEDPPGWSYYKMAFSLIEIYMDTPRLSTVQALLLLVKYNEYTQRPGFFWRTKTLLQLATQMAGDLGLSRENVMNQYDSEYHNRTFWAIYMYETLLSTEHGFKPYFCPEECTAQYPHYLKERADDYNTILNFHWMSKVIHVQGFVLQFMRSKYSTEPFDEEKEFNRLEQILNSLGQEIPQIVPSTIDVQVYFIHLIYHVVCILLYRPYTTHADDSPYNFYCQSSASSITDIVEHVISSNRVESFYGTTRGHQQIIYCLTAAITIQRAAKDTVTYLQSFDILQYEKTASILHMLIGKSPVAEIDDISPPDSQTWADTRKRHELASSSNTSSARSSPLDTSLSCPQSPSSPKIVKRISRSSFPSTPDNISYASSSTSSILPEPVFQRPRSASNRVARNRLSAPSLSAFYPNYYPSAVHSQPTSPASPYFADIHGTMMDPLFNSSPSRRSRKSIQRSTSFVGDFTIPTQRPTRNSRSIRHSEMNQLNHRYSAPPNTLFPYDIPLVNQQVMMDPSFPLDPVIPNTPNESMMRILMNKENGSSLI